MLVMVVVFGGSLFISNFVFVVFSLNLVGSVLVVFGISYVVFGLVLFGVSFGFKVGIKLFDIVVDIFVIVGVV